MINTIRQQGLEKARKRSGMFSAELVMTLPLFGIILAGLFEFALLFQARSELAEATRAGARIATMPGVRADQVEQEVRRVLSPRLQETMDLAVDPGQKTGDVVTVAIAVNMNVASPDLLWPIGFSLKNRQLYQTTRMIRE
jgi:Flp pilus assembly protein TadG